MSEDLGRQSGRHPAEGVRIIKAEEAQAAIEAGEAAGRRPDDQLRFGDVPPAPSGPRPAHRFPLPDSVDPADAVALPPLRTDSGRRGDPARSPASVPTSGPAGWDPEAGSDVTPPSAPPSAPEPPDAPQPPAAPHPPAAPQPFAAPPPRAAADPPPPPEPTVRISAPSAASQPPPPRRAPQPTSTEGDHEVEADAPPWAASAGRQPTGADSTTEMGIPHGGIPEEGITVSGAPPGMPHWSDPPTGEVPRLRFDDAEHGGSEDDMEAWRALGGRGVRWRDEDDWDEGDELADLASDVEPMGALDQNRAEHSDLYSFDEDFERVRNSRTGSQPVVDLAADDDDYAGTDEDWAPVEPVRSHSARRPARSGRPWDRGRSSATSARRGRRPTAPSAGVAGETAAVGEAATQGPAGAAAAVEPRARRAAGSTATADRPERTARTDRPTRRTPSSNSGGDLGSRVAVGVGLIVLLAVCYVIGPKALVALATVAVVASAAEAYNMTRAPGFRPATLLGLVATVGCVLGAYWRGIGAIAVVTVLLFGGAMLWYVLGVVEARPLANVAVTVMVFVWVSVLGSFSAVLLGEPQGKGLFLGAILVAVATDVCAFAVGRWIGSRPLAAHISPQKTVEGFIGGIIGAIIVGAIVGKVVHPWSGMRYGLILGLVVGLISPAGDLFESMLKRDLGIKDSGSILGGHGGLLDRFDGILLALPAAYFVTTIAHIH